MFLIEANAAAECPREAIRYASTSQRLYVSAGATCTLTDLDAITASTVLERTDSTNKIWVLRKNLYVEKGATLLLHGSEAGGDVNELRLRSDSGGFIMIRADHGTIDIDSTRITSWNESAGAPDTSLSDGRAFISVRSKLSSEGEPLESTMNIRDSDIGYLGYNGSEAYGLAWKVSGSSSGLYDKVDVFGDVTGNRIHHNYFGVYTYGAYGMQFLNNDFDKNEKYGLDPHDDSDHLTIVGNDFSNNGNHGFICSKRCNDLDIRDNRAWNNTGNGFMLHRDVKNSVVENNEAWDNTDSGLALFDVYDNEVRGNYFHGNAKAGIRFSVGARDNLIEDNVLEDNKYGLYFYRSPNDAPGPDDDGRPKRNTLIGNTISGSYQAINLKDSDDNEFIENQIGDSTNDEALLFSDGRDNVFARNVVPSTERIHIKTSALPDTTLFITQGGGTAAAQASLYIDVSNYAKAIFVETADISHRTGTTATTATPDDSRLTMLTGGAKTVSVVPIFAKPSSGTVQITPSSNTAWTAKSSSGTISTVFTIGKLTPDATYQVRRNGTVIDTVVASSTGVASVTIPLTTTSASYSIGQ